MDNASMNRFTIKVLNTLLYHQRRVRKPRATQEDTNFRTLTYSELCEAVDRKPQQATCLKKPLHLIESWCSENQVPNLNALVVTESQQRPGHLYNFDGSFPSQDWHNEIIRCIRSTDYPLFIK